MYITEDNTNWDLLSENCEQLDGLTNLEKARASRAFLFLKEELGTEFLIKAFEDGHPICSHIVNRAEWTRKWFIQMSESLREVKQHENYDSILKRIKNKNNFAEALSVLEYANKFSKAGFSLTIDPSIIINKKPKKPDLKIFNSRTLDNLYIEVSIQSTSSKECEAIETFDRIKQPLLFNRSISYAVKIHKAMSEQHLDEVVKKVEGLILKSKNENCFCFFIEDVIEIGVSTPTQKNFLRDWATKRNLEVGKLTSPLIRVDEISRTKTKIEKEQIQLPRDHCNILIIKNNRVFYSNEVQSLVNEIEEEVFKYPHLLYVVISTDQLEPEQTSINFIKKHLYIENTFEKLFRGGSLVLFNRFCDIKIAPSSISKIQDALDIC